MTCPQKLEAISNLLDEMTRLAAWDAADQSIKDKRQEIVAVVEGV